MSMRCVIRSGVVFVLPAIFAVVCLPTSPVAIRQLPPDILADRYLVMAERQIVEEDYGAARVTIDQIDALQREHKLTFSDEFHFKYARVALSAGVIRAAMDAVTKYLVTAGTAGKFYREALELLDEAEQIQTTVDEHLAQAEQLIAGKDHAAAVEAVNQVVALQRKHNLMLPDEFYFKYARVAFSAGSFKAASESLKEYLAAAGQTGEFYREATVLLENAEQMMLPLEPEMAAIPAGRFRMGCVLGMDCGRDETPVHEVMIDSFALSKYEVTFEEYDRFTAATGRKRAEDEGWGRGRRPVINVSWKDAVAYTAWLSENTDKHYRLPSEAEWEYAARAGTAMKYSWGNEIGRNRANCEGCGSPREESTAPVGAFPANAWGLHDMHGNVSEWVQDCFNDSYQGAPVDGSAWESGDCSERVLRGGSWYFGPLNLRAANRNRGTTGIRYHYDGFRVARTLTP